MTGEISRWAAPSCFLLVVSFFLLVLSSIFPLVVGHLGYVCHAVSSGGAYVRRSYVHVGTSPLAIYSAFVVRTSLSIGLLGLVCDLFLKGLVSVRSSVSSVVLVDVSGYVRGV